MNKFNFEETGGFPLETDTLNELVKAFSVFNALGLIAGHKTIISGVKVVAGGGGNLYSPGYVVINGELLEFRGGNPLPTVKIYENITNKEYEDGSVKPAFYERYVAFGTGEDSIPFDEFKRIQPLSLSQKKLVPYGMIALWPADDIANIPDGWETLNQVVLADQFEEFIHIKYTGQ